MSRVVLLKRVDDIEARVGEVIEVKAGYARNWLVPKGYALYATARNMKYFDTLRAEVEVRDKDRRQGAEKLLAKLDEKEVIVIARASEDGKLFGSVLSRDIVPKLKENFSVDLENKQVIVGNVKHTGVYEIEARLYSGVVAKMKLIVAKNEADVERLRKSDHEEEEHLAAIAAMDAMAKVPEVKEETTQE